MVFGLDFKSSNLFTVLITNSLYIFICYKGYNNYILIVKSKKVAFILFQSQASF